MANSLVITNEFPDTLERTVLSEALKVLEKLRSEGLEVILCGGWVPFITELVRRGASKHKMSVDIDLLLPVELHAPQKIDELAKTLLLELEYQKSRNSPCRLEKTVDRRVIELDLLVGVVPDDPQQMITRLPGEKWKLDAAIADGGQYVFDHLKEVEIKYMEGGVEKRVRIQIPDAVGFFILKSSVTYHREKSKDAYDIYYYCAFSEQPETIRRKLQATLNENAVKAAVSRISQIFQHPDSKWVEMVLEHLGIQGPLERDREAQLIVRAVMNVFAELEPPRSNPE